MNSRAPISITETPGSLWKWGTIISVIGLPWVRRDGGTIPYDPAAVQTFRTRSCAMRNPFGAQRNAGRSRIALRLSGLRIHGSICRSGGKLIECIDFLASDRANAI